MLFVIHYFLIMVLSKEISYQFDAQGMNSDLWKTKDFATPDFQQCNNIYIFGGSGLNMNSAAIIRNFLLQPHYRVYIDIEFYRIDSWDNDYLIIKLEDSTIYQQQFHYSSGTNLCGDSAYDDEIITIQITSKHTSNLAVVQINTQDINNDNNESWGIKYFTLSIEPCPYGCVYCESDDFIQCKQWSLQYWDQNVNLNYWFDNPLYSFYYYEYVPYFSQPLPQHTKLMIKFRLYIWSNNDVKLDIIIDNEVYSSKHKMSTLLFNAQFEIIIPFFNHIKNTIGISLQITGGSQPQLKLKDFQILLQKDHELTNLYSPSYDDGWIYGQSIRECGDQNVVGLEQNNMPCIYLCKNCHQCKFGKCEICELGYQLDLNNNCSPICGDGILIPYYEQCDVKNQIMGDGCYNCKLECSNSCSLCQNGRCLKCQIGFKLIQLICEPVCGDGIIIHEFEECDDGNQLPYDGCFLCKYQCQLNCQLCIEGKCNDICSYGDIMIDSQCHSVCGNKIVSQLEECDDGNNQLYDGCYQCLFSCPLNCNLCEQGLCLECEENYELENKVCQSIDICGNGIVGSNEDCDDGNTVPNDGCYKCKIEENWICDPSLCVFESAPTIILTFLNQNGFSQYVNLTFSQQVRVQGDEPILDLTLLNVPDGNFNIIVYPVIGLTTDLSFAQYLLEIQLNCLMSEKPILQINLENVVNQYDMQLTQTTQQLKLLIPKYLTPSQKKTAQQLLQFNKNIIYIMGGVSLLSLILGESSLIQDSLNTLQYLSLLKFLNVQMPQNVIIFFQFSDLVSIVPVLQLLKIDFKFQVDQVQKKQFAFYSQETSIIANLTCQFFQSIGLLLIFVFLKISQRACFTQTFIKRYFEFMIRLQQKTNQSFVMIINNFLYKIGKLIFRVSYLLTSEGIKLIFLMNSWDLLFKIFLFFSDLKVKSCKTYLELSISLIIVLVYIKLLMILFRRDKAIIFIRLLRQVLFLGFLIFIQQNQVLQILLISITNLFYLLILKYSDTHYIELIIEGAIVLFTFTSILYFQDFQDYISEFQKIQIGFVQISILASTLSIKLINYLFVKGRLLLKQLRTHQICQKKTI